MKNLDNCSPGDRLFMMVRGDANIRGPLSADEYLVGMDPIEVLFIREDDDGERAKVAFIDNGHVSVVDTSDLFRCTDEAILDAANAVDRRIAELMKGRERYEEMLAELGVGIVDESR